MNYDEWIERERKTRVSILLGSPLIQKTGLYRVCRGCGEICLCHEETCPNCNAGNITEEKIDKDVVISGKRIRCSFRYENLTSY